MSLYKEKTIEDFQKKYNEIYFENGLKSGVSGYENYRWLPELTLRMAHYLIQELCIRKNATILDYGCAKGFLVKALRILDINAFGCDVSKYAIHSADQSVKSLVWHITGVEDPKLITDVYDWIFAKDVLEHISEDELNILVPRLRKSTDNMFVAVPLAASDNSTNYVIPEYDKDVTHIIRKTIDWWSALFVKHGWKVIRQEYRFPGCKENWTNNWEKGNGFLVLKNPKKD